MGGDNLAQFHRWRDWRRIARMMPIALIARPGYDRAAYRAIAMSWLRRFVHPAATARHWPTWRLPALVLLPFRPYPTSATRLDEADPAWHRRILQRRDTDEPTTQYVPSPHTIQPPTPP